MAKKATARKADGKKRKAELSDRDEPGRKARPAAVLERPALTLPDVIDRSLTLEIVRVTERAAVAAARLRGRGDEMAADQAAVDAMRRELNRLPIHGTVVIGEGERDAAPMLFIGEEVGDLSGPRVDIALDPLEGTTLCAKAQPDAIAVIAIAEAGSLLNAPDVYMDKIAIGPGYPPDTVHLDADPGDNVRSLARAKGVPVHEITACILDRPRHAKLIASVRETGAAVRLITDGDVAGVIHTTNPEETGIDIYMGVGGAPEGVLAAAALRCIGGQMQGRLILDDAESRRRAAEMGISDPAKIYDTMDLASGDVLFAATGVTDGSLLSGVRFGPNGITTDSLVMRSSTGTSRQIRARHPTTEKFHLD
jgi:fructose-1,6-bisphosphatase II / sedoheptulose-1,7-bisphosphatase